MFKRVNLRVLVAGVMLILFLIANRAAYKGFFHGDDLDNLAWNHFVGVDTYVHGLFTPIFDRSNFRPVGHSLFFLMGRYAGLHFEPYVVVIQIIHLVNAVLVWFLLRRMQVPDLAAFGATLFFVFHPATFAAHWQPMYIFDLLCGTFSILCLTFFVQRRWVLSFVCFWLAYKAKEIGIMLPAVLFLYEFMFGERRWKPLVPFFLVSLMFGSQALMRNAASHDAYTLKFSPRIALHVASFYGERLFAGWAGFAAVAIVALAVARSRRALWGILSAFIVAIPLIALPNRMFAVYLYVPVVFMAIGISAILSWRPQIVVPVFALLWILATYYQLRGYRSEYLAASQENKRYVQQVARFVQSSPGTMDFVVDGFPPTLFDYGIVGSVKFLTGEPSTEVTNIESPDAKRVLEKPDVGVLVWNSATRQLNITSRNPATADATFVRMDTGIPVWQLGEGWFTRDGSFRWTSPVAEANLYRPVTARKFEVQVNVGPQQIRDIKQLRLRVFLDRELLGTAEFDKPGWQTASWPVESGPQKLVQIRFESDPAYRTPLDPRVLGSAIGAFGFR
ncbi:MAG TPA: hypothetical protein VE621_05815 [Bryobacteraceae bacterium]|nr:hypothetical protein [Bryobacteraceae bacterium]